MNTNRTLEIEVLPLAKSDLGTMKYYLPRFSLVILTVAFAASFAWSVTYAGDAEDDLLASSLVNGDVRGVDIAIKRGANVRALLRHPNAPSIQKSAVSLAISKLMDRDDKNAAENVDRMLRLLFAKGAPLSKSGDDLVIPIAKGQARIVKILLDNGANPHFRIDGYLPIELAVKYEQQQLIPIFAERSSQKLEEGDVVQMRLVAAAGSQNLAGVLHAISSGARLNVPDVAGKYAIVQLVSMPLIEPTGYQILKWMLDEGKVDVRAKERGDQPTTALHKIIEMNSFREEDYFSTAAIAAMFLEGGADVSSLDYRGRTPLHYAADVGNHYAVDLLLRSHAKVMTRDGAGRTPLDLAKSPRVIELLKKYGARE